MNRTTVYVLVAVLLLGGIVWYASRNSVSSVLRPEREPLELPEELEPVITEDDIVPVRYSFMPSRAGRRVKTPKRDRAGFGEKRNPRTSVRIGNYNVGSENTPRGIRRDLRKLSQRFAVIALTDIHPAALGDAIPAGWASVKSRGDATFIYNKAKVREHVSWRFLAAHGRDVEPVPGRRNRLPDRHGVATVFEWKATGDRFGGVTGHAPSHIEKGGRPRPGMDARVAMAAEFFRNMAENAKRLRERDIPVFVAGDDNVDWRADKGAEVFPRHIYGKAGGRAHWSTGLPKFGTLGNRFIDTIWLFGARIKARSAWVGLGYRSNHRPTGVVLYL